MKSQHDVPEKIVLNTLSTKFPATSTRNYDEEQEDRFIKLSNKEVMSNIPFALNTSIGKR